MRYYRDEAVVPEFAKMATALAEILGARVTEAQIRAHAQMLDDIPIDQLRYAFGRAARELEAGYYPTPGKIRSFVHAPADDAAIVAWTAFGQAAAVVGSYATIDVEDAAAAAALVAVFGSWPAFCAMEDGPALALKRQEFLAAYRQARRSPARGARRLVGLCGPADPEVATRTWIGRLAAGGEVEVVRDRPLLSPSPPSARIGDGS